MFGKLLGRGPIPRADRDGDHRHDRAGWSGTGCGYYVLQVVLPVDQWLTSVDHKKIGVMYVIVAMVMLLRGFADAIMMRTQLAMATEGSPGYLPPEHYDQIFTAHGVIMIIFMAMPFFTGLMNLALPLQIGARDVAYPFLNS